MGALRPGYEVTSEITLVRRLGAGGMGTVWLATHNKLRTEVVVKFLSEQLASDQDACSRFEREVHATLQVRSPHVVQTLDHGITDGGIPYLVMEWLEGNDLAKEMRARQQLPADEVMHIMEGLATALTKAHERGIVHRDIKPANVFLVTGSPRPFVKLVDFGIAKRLEDETMTATNALLGTPAYMSPEQMDGVQQVDHRTDLWALGVLAFHMLAGNPPFRGSHIAHIAHAIMHGERPRISAARPDLPPALDAWVERALARDPMHRFASARELVDTLGMAFGDMVYTTNRRAAILALGTGPHLPGSQPHLPIAPSSQPGSSIPIPVYMTTGNGQYMPTSTSMSSLDMVGATLGPTANTQSPYGRRQAKWWIMGVAGVGIALIALSFKIGYGMRASPAAQPTDIWNTPPPPPVMTTAPTSVQTTPVILTAPPPAMTQPLPATLPAPAPQPVPQPVAKPAPAPKPIVAPHRPGPAPRPSPGPKPKDPTDDVGF